MEAGDAVAGTLLTVEDGSLRIIIAFIVAVTTMPLALAEESPSGRELLGKIESHSDAERAYAKGYILGVLDGYLNQSLDEGGLLYSGSLKYTDDDRPYHRLRCIGKGAVMLSDADLVDFVRLELKTSPSMERLRQIVASEAILSILERKFPCPKP